MLKKFLSLFRKDDARERAFAAYLVHRLDRIEAKIWTAETYEVERVRGEGPSFASIKKEADAHFVAYLQEIRKQSDAFLAKQEEP